MCMSSGSPYLNLNNGNKWFSDFISTELQRFRFAESKDMPDLSALGFNSFYRCFTCTGFYRILAWLATCPPATLELQNFPSIVLRLHKYSANDRICVSTATKHCFATIEFNLMLSKLLHLHIQ